MGRASILLVLLVTVLIRGFDLWVLLLSVFGLGFGQSLSRLGTNSLLPETVPAGVLGKANGLMAFSQEVSAVVGSPLAGILLAYDGIQIALLTNFVTYVFSSYALFKLSGQSNIVLRKSLKVVERGRNILEEAREGIRYIRKERALLKLTVSSLAGNFFTSLFLPFLVVYVTQILMKSTIVFGVFNGLIGAGFAIGALLSARQRFGDKFAFWFTLSWGVAGLSILGTVLFPETVPAAIFLFGWGIGAGFGDTVLSTGIQKYVPPKVLARYLGMDEALGLASSPAGQISGGMLISRFGVMPVFALASLGGSISVFVLVIFSDVRELSAS